MPRTKAFAANAGSADVNAVIERVAPDVLALLSDGVPRTRAAVVEALADRHEREAVLLTLIRLAITDQVEDMEGRYTLASGAAPDMG